MFFLDGKNAFGSVPFTTVKKVLKHIVDKHSFKYFDQVLQERKGVVVHNGEESEPVTLPLLGVPQGEPISPTCYLLVVDGLKIFFNDTDAFCISFADDLSLVFLGKKEWTKERMDKYVQEMMAHCEKYLKDSGTELNYAKCSFMVFGKKITDEQFLTKEGNYIKKQKRTTVLGYRINEQLDDKNQFNHMKNELHKHRERIYNMIGFDTTKRLLDVAYSLFYGTLNYLANIMPIMKNKAKYNQLQSIVNNSIMDVLQIKHEDRRGIPVYKLLNAVGWLHHYNNQKRLQLKFLNNIFRTKITPFLYKIITNHLIYNNGDKFVDEHAPYSTAELNNEQLAKVRFNSERHKELLELGLRIPKLCNNDSIPRNVFPGCAFPLFNELPEVIREHFGTKTFEQLVDIHFHSLCQHHLEPGNHFWENCRKCTQRNFPMQSKSTAQIVKEFNEIKTLVDNNIQAGEDFNIDLTDYDKPICFKKIVSEVISSESIDQNVPLRNDPI